MPYQSQANGKAANSLSQIYLTGTILQLQLLLNIMNTPTATTRTTRNTTTNRQVQQQEKTTPRPAVNCHLPNKKSRRHKRTLSNCTDQWKRTIPTSKEPKSKDSMASSSKWQHKARQLISNWTHRHTDAYLAIPEKAMEWNVEPG